jgi:hypothetical protein
VACPAALSRTCCHVQSGSISKPAHWPAPEDRFEHLDSTTRTARRHRRVSSTRSAPPRMARQGRLDKVDVSKEGALGSGRGEALLDSPFAEFGDGFVVLQRSAV